MAMGFSHTLEMTSLSNSVPSQWCKSNQNDSRRPQTYAKNGAYTWPIQKQINTTTFFVLTRWQPCFHRNLICNLTWKFQLNTCIILCAILLTNISHHLAMAKNPKILSWIQMPIRITANI